MTRKCQAHGTAASTPQTGHTTLTRETSFPYSSSLQPFSRQSAYTAYTSVAFQMPGTYGLDSSGDGAFSES
jgi:hypothetical protein